MCTVYLFISVGVDIIVAGLVVIVDETAFSGCFWQDLGSTKRIIGSVGSAKA